MVKVIVMAEEQSIRERTDILLRQGGVDVVLHANNQKGTEDFRREHGLRGLQG